MFKIESFTNNVYDGEVKQQYETITDTRIAMKEDADKYKVKHCIYLISYEGMNVELWEVKFGEFTKVRDYLAGE